MQLFVFNVGQHWIWIQSSYASTLQANTEGNTHTHTHTTPTLTLIKIEIKRERMCNLSAIMTLNINNVLRIITSFYITKMWPDRHWPQKHFSQIMQPGLMAICTYFTRWLISTNSSDLTRTNSYDFDFCVQWPTPDPAPKPTRHWGLDKSYKIIQKRSYKCVWISHLIKYVRIDHEIALDNVTIHIVLVFNIRSNVLSF